MNTTLATSLVAAFVTIIGVWAWAIYNYGRVNRHVAPMLEAERIRWDGWHGAIVLHGAWNGVPVTIRSCYVPGQLFVTMRVVTRPPDLAARVDRSGNIAFRSIRTDHLGVRTLAQANEADLAKPAGVRRADIAAYFTPARVQSLRVLLEELKWQRFLRDGEGITVSRFGTQGARWKPQQARDQVLRTLIELQTLDSGT